tara:strand:+ start:841 stop:1008 length:168 start_codon:yes stop_codon:yes gene_type:complete
MKVKDLVTLLENSHEPDNEVIFYRLENSVLTECQVETILNADDRCEITIEELDNE